MSNNKKENTDKSSKEARSNYWADSPVYRFLHDRPQILIFLLAIIVFGQTVTFGFVQLDDYAIIEEILVGIGSISNIFNSFTEGYGGNFYRPLQTFTFVIDMELSDGAAWSFHLGNLILHSLTSVAVFYLFRSLKFNVSQSLIAGSIFAVSPLLTHAIAWIPSRGDLIFGLSVVVGFFGFIRFLDTSKWKYYALHIVGFLFAFFSKETAVFFPVLCFLYILIYRKNGNILSMKNIYLYAGWFLSGILWLYLRSLSVKNIPDMRVLGIEQFIENMPLLPETISKFILPFYISVMPTYNIILIISGIVLTGLLIYRMISIKSKRGKDYLFAALWFFGFMFPVMIFRHPDTAEFYDYMDHRAYLPVIGLLFAIMISIPEKYKDLRLKRNAIIFLIIIIVFSGLSFAQARNYRNPIKFWVSAIKYDNTRPRFYYGIGLYMLDELEDYKRAKVLFERMLKVKPNSPDALSHLGLIELKQKNYKDAEDYLFRALKEEPRKKEAVINLTAVYNNTGRYEKTISLLNEYLRRYPNDKNAFLNLFEAHRRLSNYREAYALANKLLELGERKNYYSALLNIGADFYKEKKYEEAIEVTELALQLPGEHARGYNNLGLFNMRLKNYKKAEKFLLKAHEINPRLPNALSNLIDLYITLDNRERAAFYAKKYLELGNRKLNDDIMKLLKPYM